ELADAPLVLRGAILATGQFVEFVDTAGVHLQRSARHRTVDIDRQHGNAFLVFEAADPVDQLLDAAERKGRNDDLAATIDGPVDDLGEPAAFVVDSVRAVAVGRFDEQHVGFTGRLRVVHDGAAVAPQIAAEQYDLALRLQAD